VTEIAFLHPGRIHLLWLALALVGGLAALELRASARLEPFVAAAMQGRLAARPSRGRRLARLGLILAALVAGVLALMRPQARQATQEAQKTRVSADILVLLDASKSMLAEDAAPNRLQRAKAEIRDLVAPLAGSRLGLMAFAGRAALLCPLTTDHGFFRLVLDTVDVRSAGRGGTRIGDALRKATAELTAGGGDGSARLILLFTDGEDHDSYALDAAKEAHATGVRVVAVGFGDEKGSEVTMVDPATGARSPLMDREGRPVRSRLDGETLRQIALATEGAYVPAGTASLDIRSILEQHVRPLLREARTTEVRVVRAERYPWFLIACLAALVGAVWAGAPPPRRRARPVEEGEA
jgi:Ca-activated chloride channel family protein